MEENIIFKQKHNIKYGSNEYANYYVVVAKNPYGGDMYNILENDKLLLDTWMDWIDYVSSNHFPHFNGCIGVRLKHKANIFNVKTKKFVYDKPYKDWFYGVGPDCCRTYSTVYKYRGDEVKANLLKSNGELISNVWYDEAYSSDNYPVVAKKNKYNFLNEKGNPISPIWFDHVFPFEDTGNGLQAIVSLNGQSNVINPDGKCLSKQWFDYVSKVSHITLDEKRIISYQVIIGNLRYGDNLFKHMRTDGTFLSETWWTSIRDIDPIGYIAVSENGKKNIVTRSGKLISEEWFDAIIFDTLHWTRDQYVDVDSFKLYCDDGIIKHIKYNKVTRDYELVN